MNLGPGATSKSGKFIRLTEERWNHIVEEHGELVEWHEDVMHTIAEPSYIFEGGAGEFLAAREVITGKFLIVVYRESDEDGFVITAFLTRKVGRLLRRKQLWP